MAHDQDVVLRLSRAELHILAAFTGLHVPAGGPLFSPAEFNEGVVRLVDKIEALLKAAGGSDGGRS